MPDSVADDAHVSQSLCRDFRPWPDGRVAGWHEGMPVHLETTIDDHVAIIRGIHSDEAFERLARDLSAGTALEAYAGLVVDLGSESHSAQALDALERAAVERMRRHQVVCSAESASVDETLQRVLSWRRMLAASPLRRLPLVPEIAFAASTAFELVAGTIRWALRAPAGKGGR